MPPLSSASPGLPTPVTVTMPEDVHVTVAHAHAMTDAMERACIAPADRAAEPWHGKDEGPKLKP